MDGRNECSLLQPDLSGWRACGIAQRRGGGFGSETFPELPCRYLECHSLCTSVTASQRRAVAMSTCHTLSSCSTSCWFIGNLVWKQHDEAACITARDS